MATHVSNDAANAAFEPTTAGTEPKSSLRQVAASGGLAGIATGFVATLVDTGSVLIAGRAGNPALLAIGVASLVIPTFGLIGLLSALWQHAIDIRLRRLRPSGAAWWWGALASIPLVVATLWVPWGWLSSHWGSLSPRQKLLAGAFYACTAVAIAVVGRVTFAIRQRYRDTARATAWFHWPLVAGAVLSMASFYWVDRTYYTDDYEDFHYGAAGAYAVSAAVVTLLLRESLRRRRTSPRLRTPSSRAFALWFAVLVALLAMPALELLSVKHRKALVATKVTQTLQAWADLDGDGYSTLFGSADCAPLDGNRSPGTVDIPGNGIDDDCSGSDASRWPQREKLPSYPVPNADGFNLLLITVDTLRADRVGAYGYTRPTSPNIDGLASEGVRFASAFSQSTKTYESVPSLFTGLYPVNIPRDHKHPRTVGKKPYVYTMTDEAVLLTELVRQKGYHTYAIQDLWLLHTLGLDRGFDDYATSTEITAPILETVKTPFFMWLHYFEPHEPYLLHPGFDFGTKDSDRYDSEIAKVDSMIGKVLARLRDKNLEQSTVVVLTSDHGEEFGEHGGTSHTSKLHWESLHVPLIIKIPGHPPARVDETVELVDVLPTLCEAFRLDASCSSFDGQSLWATQAGLRDHGFGFAGAFSETELRNDFFFRQSVVTKDFRFNLNVDKHNVELFDLRADPREQHDVADARPDIVRKLWDEIGLRPYRDLGPHFERATRGDIDGLVSMLPRIRNEDLLGFALSIIARHPNPNAIQAVNAVRRRPGLSSSFHEQLEDLFGVALAKTAVRH
jgi:arylsulfatase A-like enzyme